MENGKVPIQLDRKRYLRFDFNAWCEVETVLGISLMDNPNPMSLGWRGQRAVLYAGLLHEDPTITVKQAGDLFNDYDKQMIQGKLIEAIRAANPKASESADTGTDPNAKGLTETAGSASTNAGTGA